MGGPTVGDAVMAQRALMMMSAGQGKEGGVIAQTIPHSGGSGSEESLPTSRFRENSWFRTASLF